MRALLLSLLLIPDVARADGWLVVEAPVALATSEAQAGVFRPGVMPAIGAYAENEHFAIGLRWRAGVLRDGPAPTGGLSDPGYGGLTTASVALRVPVKRAWFELAAGGGVTGTDVVPAVEAGVGWDFSIGTIDVGPSVRYVRVQSQSTMDAFGTAELVLAGVDLRFGRARPKLIERVAHPARVEAVAKIDRDGDRVIEREDSCIRDATGCPHTEVVERISEDIVVKDDRIVFDERILFAFDRARVRSRGREILAQLVKAWHEHPEWRHVTIEGHTDVRGSDGYNQKLSELRADRVRAVMVKLGCSEADLSVVGFGRSRVRDTGESEAAHERNRRVELVIDRSVP